MLNTQELIMFADRLATLERIAQVAQEHLDRPDLETLDALRRAVDRFARFEEPAVA